MSGSIFFCAGDGSPMFVLNDDDLISLVIDGHYVKRTNDANSWIQAVDAPPFPMPANYAFTVKIVPGHAALNLRADNGNYVYRKNDGNNSMAADQANIDPGDPNALFWPYLVVSPSAFSGAGHIWLIGLRCSKNSCFLSLPGIRASGDGMIPDKSVFGITKINR